MFDQLRGFAEHVRSYWTGPLASRDPALADALGYGPTSTGISVTSDTAFNSSAFWSAVSIIAGDVASLPLELFKRDKDRSTAPFLDSKLYELLHDTPNPEMTSFVFREAGQGHALTWGNAFAEIERNGSGRPAALWPLTPDRVVPFRQDGRVKYRVRNWQQGETILEAADMLHVPGLGFDGLMGYSVIEKARESIGMGLAMQRFGGSFFGNGSTFGGVLSHPQNLTKEVKQSIRESIDAVHTGVDRAHKFVILGGGMSYTKLGIPPNDAQFLESRRFEIEEIARWFHMPQHKLNGLDHATFSNIVQLNLEYYTSCVRGWLVRWEQELNRKLIPPLERKSQYFKHNPEAILRADPTGRADFYTKLFQVGGITINQICELENQNGIGPDGDTRFVPANMLPLERLINPPAPAPLPTVTDVTPPNDPKALPPKREDVLDAEVRDVLAELATTQTTMLALVTAERDASSQAERDQFAAEIEAARAEIARLNDAVAAHALAADALAQDVAAARVETEAERSARESVEREFQERGIKLADALTYQQAFETRTANAEQAASAAAVLVEERTREVEQAQAQIVAAEARIVEEAARAASAEQSAESIRADADRLNADLAERLAGLAAADVALTEARAIVTSLEAAAAERAAAEQARLTGVMAAHRALIVDAMGRMVRRETEKARRHQATPEKLRSWIEVFYPTHEEICVEALRPAMRAHLAWQESTEDVDTVTLGLVREHIAESVKQLRAVVDLAPEEIPLSLERMLTRWEQQRPEGLADRILKKEIDHAVRTAALG